MRSVLLYALVCAGAVLSPAPAAAQSTANGRVVLAAVVGPQGRPLVDVDLDDFVVAEGDQPRDVLDVHVADYPLAIVIDDRTETAASLATARASARRFIERVGERPVAIFRFSSTNAAANLDDDRTTVLDRLAGIDTAVRAEPAALDTLARAAALLQETGAPFSAVIVVAGAPIDATAPVRGELLPAIQSSGAAVHVVEVQPRATGSSNPNEPDLLRVIADQTRGQFTPIFSTASFDAALDRLADRLAIELMIQYLAPPGPKQGDVRVGVRIPGARVVGLGVK